MFFDGKFGFYIECKLNSVCKYQNFIIDILITHFIQISILFYFIFYFWKEEYCDFVLVPFDLDFSY